MKGRPSLQKRQKEIQRLEKQRDKADRRKLRKAERALGGNEGDGTTAVDDEGGIASGELGVDVEPGTGGPPPIDEHGRAPVEGTPASK